MFAFVLSVSLFVSAPADTTPVFSPAHRSPLPGVQVYKVAVAGFVPGEWACEPSIAINPLNPSRAVAGTVLNRVHSAMDYGQKWQSQTITSLLGVYGDPVMAYGPDGRLYFFHLSDSDGKHKIEEGLLDRMVVQWSDDNGKTWSPGTGIGYNAPKDQDKEWVCIDQNTGHLHLTWTEFDKYNSKKSSDRSRILYSRSTDRGETWSKPVKLGLYEGDCLDDDGTAEGAVPCVDGQGRIHVLWSRDRKIWHTVSSDGGNTWPLKEKMIASQPGGWNFSIPHLGRGNGLPFTVKRGTHELISLFGTKENDRALLYTMTSTNNGDSWDSPVLFDPKKDGSHTIFGAIATDPITQHVHVICYAANTSFGTMEVYWSRSKDGAKTWEHFNLTDAPFVPSPKVFFGDYNHIAAYDGHIYGVWTEQWALRNEMHCLVVNEKLFDDE